MQLQREAPFLARVAHGCGLDEALSPELNFSIVEYKHTPQRGVAGFFGTFTKKENELYDPNDKRKGPKFVRHHKVTRQEVVMYDVQTWVDRELLAERAADELPPEDCLRIKPSSLRALAAIRSELTVPASLPPTHMQMEAEEAEDRRVREERARVGDTDDPPAPIPDGYEVVEYTPGAAIKHFMLWTRLDGGGVKWHQGKVVKQLVGSARGRYTHDANFVDAPGVRGVKLTKATYDEGCLVILKAKDVTSTTSKSKKSAPKKGQCSEARPIVLNPNPTRSMRPRNPTTYAEQQPRDEADQHTEEESDSSSSKNEEMCAGSKRNERSTVDGERNVRKRK